MRLPDIDSVFYLMGDEDGGVGLQCRLCDLGGRPVTYYGHDPYPSPEVVSVTTITDFLSAGVAHVVDQHAERQGWT